MSPDILTAAGRYFSFVEPESCDFSIEEIAHALSNLCRFTGHVRTFYSVAQHSVLVSRIVPPQDALAGLLHDAPEAFIGDVSKPLKMMLADYQQIEERVEAAVFARFGLAPKLPASVKRADLIALITERRDLMPWHASAWECAAGLEPLPEAIQPVCPLQARAMFLDRFMELVPDYLMAAA